MNAGDLLTKQHILSDYRHAARQDPTADDSSASQVRGIVYLETDRRLLPASADTPLEEWALQPLEEIKFLRSIVNGEYGARDAQMLLGLVPWAPVDREVGVFERWLNLAEETAGPETWRRVKGFRFLLQGITDRAVFEDLVLGEGFVAVLKSFRDKGRRFSFDVGVDQHSGGVWQLETVAQAIEKVHAGVEDEEQKTVFVLSMYIRPTRDLERC